jgi:hypothetical protein
VPGTLLSAPIALVSIRYKLKSRLAELGLADAVEALPAIPLLLGTSVAGWHTLLSCALSLDKFLFRP